MRSARTLALLTILALAFPAFAGAPSADFKPDPKSVRHDGPAYCYPQAGWLVLHIEGDPYERGRQHGTLLAEEIEKFVKAFAAMWSDKDPAAGLRSARTITSALFLRKFDREYLEEMQGIADGAAAAGATFERRPIDLLDIAALNCWMELDTLGSALDALPTGLEGVQFPKRQVRARPRASADHCSAFVATGPATADGKIVFGHITMSSLRAAKQSYVWLDVKPTSGHRVLMQTYPGGIQSGMDYYMNDAGLLVTETTLAQTRYEIESTPLASRIRKALQYADSIDQAVALLKKGNNGLYTNEWLLADTKTNEIAMFELGTHKTRLWRSSRGEWFGGTEGFYWGCNNTKDLDVRLETVPSMMDRPDNAVWHPSPRDKMWVQLYRQNKGKIGLDFGRMAFTTPPLAAYHSLDAKYTTTDMAKELKTWAIYGPPLGRTWVPSEFEKSRQAEIGPLVSNPWTVLSGDAPPAAVSGKAVTVDLGFHKRGEQRFDPAAAGEGFGRPTKVVWHGTILPKTDADIWLAAAFADYERLVAREQGMSARRRGGNQAAAQKDRMALALFGDRSRYLAAARAGKDVPLAETRSDPAQSYWYDIAAGKGVLLLDALRTKLGAKTFDEAMDSFGRDHAGKEVTTAEFVAHVEKAAGKKLDDFFTPWLKEPGLPTLVPVAARNGKPESAGPVYSVRSFNKEALQALIVYGTRNEVATNREAAELLQQAIRSSGYNVTVPIKTDTEVTDADLRGRHLLLIGRPGTNAVVERFRDATPLRFGTGSFTLEGKSYAHPETAVVAAGDNPLNPRYSLVILTGLSAASTRHLAETFMQGRGGSAGTVYLAPHGGRARMILAPNPG